MDQESEKSRDLSEIQFKVGCMTYEDRNRLIEMLRRPALPDLTAIEQLIADLQRQLAKANKEIHRARTDVTYWWDFNTESSETISVITELTKQLTEAQAEIERLREGLRKYGNHQHGCFMAGRCVCGYAALLEGK